MVLSYLRNLRRRRLSLHALMRWLPWDIQVRIRLEPCEMRAARMTAPVLTRAALSSACNSRELDDTFHSMMHSLFLSRLTSAGACVGAVLVSNFRRYFKLASYVSTFTDRSIVIAMGVPSLKASIVTRPLASARPAYVLQGV